MPRGFVQRRFLQRLRTSVPDLDHAHGVAETSPLSEIEAGPSGWPHCQSIGKGARDVPATLLARTNDRPSRACSGSVKRSRKFENPRGLGVPSRIFSTQSVRPDFSRVSGKRCPYCPRRWVTAQPSIRRSALLTSPPSSRSTVYAVFLPYAMVPIKQITHNVLKLLALPRGLEPLFSP